jgi:hypothetical protein
MTTKVWSRNTQAGAALEKVQEAIRNPTAALIPKPPSDVSDSIASCDND